MHRTQQEVRKLLVWVEATQQPEHCRIRSHAERELLVERR